MKIVYKNTNDQNELHVGILLTSNIHKNTVYVDVITEGHLKTGEPDWKKSHINSVYMKDIVGTEEEFAEYFV